jgi:hypothetical protein
MKTIKTAIIVLTASILLTYSGVANSQEQFKIESYSNKDKEIELSSRLIGYDLRINKTRIDNIIVNSAADKKDKEKDPVLGAVFSGLIPGTGQFYAKSYIKAAIFAAIEAGLWIAYGIYQGKGNDQTEYYQGYADGNWDVRRYAEWLVQQNFQGSSGINPNEPDLNVLRGQVNICESQNFSHTLPPYGDQQYYEVIGKYQNFLKGWSTSIGKDINKNNYGTYKLDQVDYYMGERQLANDYYGYGTTSLIIVMLNHVVSSIDGVLSVNSYNNKISAKGNVGFVRDYSVKTGKYGISPQAHITITF